MRGLRVVALVCATIGLMVGLAAVGNQRVEPVALKIGLVADTSPPARGVPPPVLDTGDEGPPLTLYPLAEALDRIGDSFPEAAAGGYWDTSSTKYYLRIVAEAPGANALRTAVEAALAAHGRLPAPIEITTGRVSMATLVAAADRLDVDRTWAGPHAPHIHGVLADRLNMLVRVSASSNLNEVADLAAAASGVDAYARYAEGPGVPQGSGGSRRNDNPSPGFYNGVALWNQLHAPSVWTAPGSAWCTGGFRMNKGSTHFIASAEHCGVYNTYYWHRGNRIARVSGVYTAGGWDLTLLARFTESGATTTVFTPPTFFGHYNTSTTSPVTAVLPAYAIYGEPAWSSGANGGRVAMRILGRQACTGAGSALLSVAETNYGAGGDSQWTMPGDSGGPIVRANTATSNPSDQIAVGVHNCGNEVNLSWFTPIHILEDLSDSVVATQAP